VGFGRHGNGQFSIPQEHLALVKNDHVYIVDGGTYKSSDISNLLNDYGLLSLSNVLITSFNFHK